MSLPTEIQRSTKAAVDYLHHEVRHEVILTSTHRTVMVSCWDDSETNRRHVAHYLVGLRACAIDAALNIRSQMEDTREDRVELLESVTSVVGEENDSLNPNQKTTERNPWIAEGIWHLCMVIASRKPEIHPVGQIIALNQIHIRSKDHGLDVAAIYEEDGLFGLSIVESKAYKDDPVRAVREAAAFFEEIDKGMHSTRVRQCVQVMRTGLPRDTQKRISASFWKDQRSYLPNPHYEAGCRVDWHEPRPSLEKLKPGSSNILVMPHGISSFDGFFDSIAVEMRAFARSLQKSCTTSTRDD